MENEFIICQSCGKKTISIGKFCNNCGIAIHKDFIICKNCGEKNLIESNYCNKCAAPLKIVYQPPVQPSYYEKPKKEKSFRLIPDNGTSAIGCLILVIIILLILFLSGAFGHIIIF